MKMKKLIALVLASAMFVSVFAGCSSSSSEDSSSSSSSSSSDSSTEDETEEEEVVVGTGSVFEERETIKFLVRGTEPEGWDDRYAEFLAQTEDTLNMDLDLLWIVGADYKDKLTLEITSGAEYDLVFDAYWVNLTTLSAEGYYADLSEYFGNEDYEGLYNSFPEVLMENNTYYGYMCYIPLYQTLGSMSCLYYRADWAEDWGIGTIESYDDMVAYWDAALAEGVLPLATQSSRGFYGFYPTGVGSIEEGTVSAIDVGVQSYLICTDFTFWTYVEDGELIATAVEGQGDEAFADFPDPYSYDFTTYRYDAFGEWNEAGYLGSDSMNSSEFTSGFDAGIAASYSSSVNDYNTDYARFTAANSEGELAYYILQDNYRNMEDGAIETSYILTNGLCLPAEGDNIERTMCFLDWIFASADNHDLIEYGVEGVDWEADGDYKFVNLSGYATAFTGYSLTWNPNYVRYSSETPDDVLEYLLWSQEESSLNVYEVTGFSFDTSSTELTTLKAQISAVTDMYASLKHGILTNGVETFSTGTEMMNYRYEQAMEVGLQDLIDAFNEQLQAYLDENY